LARNPYNNARENINIYYLRCDPPLLDYKEPASIARIKTSLASSTV